MALATVGLGSNVGASSAALVLAIAAIGELGTIIRESSVYRTAPQGGPEQREYLNQVVLVETEFPAREFLAELQRIEDAAGRTRSVRWEARTLDLDLIMYDQLISDHPTLQLPHPRAVHRRFVLEPLIEIDASATFPDGIRAVDALLEVMNQPVERVQPEQPTKLGVGWVLGQVVIFLMISYVTKNPVFPFGSDLVHRMGWFLLGTSALIVVLSILNLSSSATPFPKPLPGAQLIDTGIYGVVRHPIYGALVTGSLGLSLARGSMMGLLLSGVLFGFFIMKAQHEESMLLVTYSQYEDYMQRVPKRFLPFLI
jgi:2-amino-4-hydroxy-6-hydroxymethyldihydropteridine diphosphokinase